MATLKYLPQYFATTLNVGGGIDSSQTTGIVLQSVSGVDITKPGQVCISYSDPLDTGVAEWINYTSINGSNELVGVVRGREGYSAHSHLPGAVVQFTMSATHLNDLNDIVNGIQGKNIVTTAGGTTAYTLTPTPAITAYATGQEFVIKMNATNAGASTINVSGLGAKSLTKSGATALSSGDLAIDGIYTITYDGTQFQVSGGAGSGGSNSFIIGETPSGTVNGSNAAFDTASNYVAGSIQVYRDGQRMVGGGADYTETDSNTITFTTAPVTGSVIKVDYQTSTGTSGNADTVDTYHAAITPAASTVAVHNSSGVLFSPIYAPQGFLQNGKLSVTVGSNNLTVAIKTIAGADPSATDPVYVRIGDSVRSITAALSVTKNAGTNWFNSGGAELATKEIDYFAYVGYNATDGVVLGFARVPYGTKYGDFSATTTAETYCAISTITTAAATDYYEVVGRFAATLSAGAGYTWTVPTYTAINLIQRPIFETRWSSAVFTVSGSTGSKGTYANSIQCALYKIRGDSMAVRVAQTCTNVGSWTGNLQIQLPMGASSTYASATQLITQGGVLTNGALTVEGWAYQINSTGMMNFIVAYNTTNYGFASFAVSDVVFVNAEIPLI